MLKHILRWLPWVLFLVAFALAVIARNMSSSFQECAAQKTNSGEQQKKESSANILVAFLGRARISWQCTGAFIDQNEAAIDAVATVFIAIFTVTLWRATSDQARFTSESIRLARNEIKFTRRTFEREERMVFLQLHASMRASFDFADGGRSNVHIRPQNRGLGQGNLKAVWVRVSNAIPNLPFVYGDGCEKRLTSLLIAPKEIPPPPPLLFGKLITKNDEYLCGVLRWEDETKVGENPQRWRYSFCLRVRRNLTTNEFNVFHESGTREGWNREEPDPDEYTDEDS